MKRHCLKAISILVIVPDQPIALMTQSNILDTIGLVTAILGVVYVFYSLFGQKSSHNGSSFPENKIKRKS
jgi:hypothetical protein